MQSQTTDQDHVDILIVITACPLLSWLETWSGWPFKDRTVSACAWVWRGFSVGQIGQTAVTVLTPSLICREYVLICGWISLEPFPLIAAFKTICTLCHIGNASERLPFEKPMLTCDFARVQSYVYAWRINLVALPVEWEREHCGVHILLQVGHENILRERLRLEI